jgi:hypothetical protein
MGKEIGWSGTEIFSGLINEDYNAKLEFPQSLEVFDQMRKGDGTVAAALKAVKLLILNGNYFVSPASEDEKDIQIAEFVETQFFRRLVWSKFLAGVLLSFDFGFMVFEKVFEKDGDRIYYKRMAERLPKSIENWLTSAEYMADPNHPGIEQNVMSDIGNKNNNHNVKIAGSKLFRYTLDQEGDNYNGVSLLRPAYKHWFMKEKAYKIQLLASERNGVGLPVARHTEDTEIREAESQEIKDTLKGMRANEKAFMIEPYGWEFRLESPNSQYNFEPQILHHDRQIAKTVLAQFLELGVTKGALSQSESDQNLFLKSVMAHITAILEKINRELVTEIVMMNFDNVEAFPHIEVAAVERDDMAILSGAIQKFVQAGIITPDGEIENVIRKKFKLPEIELVEDENGNMVNPNKKSQPAPTPAPKKSEDEASEDDEDEADKKKKAEKKKFNLSDGTEFKPFRPLTLAEEKMDIPAIVNFFNVFSLKIQKDAEKFSKKLEKQLIADTRVFLKTGKFPPLPNELTEERRKVIKVLQDDLLKSFDFGKTQAARELDEKGRVKTPPEARIVAETTASGFVNKQTSDMVNETKLTASSGKAKGDSSAAIVAAVAVGLTGIWERQNKLFGTTTNTGMFNQGLVETFKVLKKSISRFQFSAILDEKTSNICLSLDGRVTKTLKEMPIPPIHANCRSRVVAVSTEQTEQPAINPPPKSVTDKISSNPFKTVQPKKPTNVKGPAKDVIDGK